MTAAEPAPTRPAVNARGRASVIPISERVGRQAGPGGRRHMHTDITDVTGPRAGGRSPQELLAEHIETTFNGLGLSLTDEETKDAFTATLQIVRRMLDGAEVSGIVDEPQRRELQALVDGMLPAPRLV